MTDYANLPLYRAARTWPNAVLHCTGFASDQKTPGINRSYSGLPFANASMVKVCP
eukprot:COSAG05_NODE_12720_length_457_cov_0.765363_2_plen_54_part_01